jgi:hypothetical protein
VRYNQNAIVIAEVDHAPVSERQLTGRSGALRTSQSITQLEFGIHQIEHIDSRSHKMNWRTWSYSTMLVTKFLSTLRMDFAFNGGWLGFQQIRSHWVF